MMLRRGARAVRSFVLIAWLSSGAASFALVSAPASADARKPSRALVVVDRRNVDAVDTELADTLRELLGRVGLELAAPEGAPPERVLAYVYLDATQQGVRVTVRSAADDSTVRRDVPRADTPALLRDTLAHVVLGTVEPMSLAGETRSEPPAPADVAAPERVDDVPMAADDDAPLRRLLLAARTGPHALASERLTAVFGGSAGLSLGGRAHPSLWLEGAGAWPSRVERADLRARVALGAVRLIALLEVLSTARFGLHAGMAAGADVVAFAPQESSMSVRFEGTTRRIQPVFGPRLEARMAVGSRLYAALGTGVDIDTSPRRWVLDTGVEQVALLELARVRPYAYLAVGFSAWRARREGAGSAL